MAEASPAPVASLAPVTPPPALDTTVEARPLILVRYFASAAEAAGRDEELLPAYATVGELRAALIASYGDVMARVLASGSFLIDGVVSRNDSRTLGLRVDVLPPFAGG